MGGCALYYVIRKNLSIAMPLLGEIGISKVQLGAESAKSHGSHRCYRLTFATLPAGRGDPGHKPDS